MAQTLTLHKNSNLLRDALASGNPAVVASLLGPAFRGLVLRRGKTESSAQLPVRHAANFDFTYQRDFPEMARLYEAAKSSQWNATTDLDWSINVDREERQLLPASWMPLKGYPAFESMDAKSKADQRHSTLSWLLSQFLHGEQGALFAAAQVTQAVPWLDGKLYGSSQVVDEGRHVEVFHRYVTQKLEKLYQINDNLYVVVDALMTDSRWDVKFLGMQILIEGLALGAFGTFRMITDEPLLKQLLTYVITDEARHVHYGVLALSSYLKELTEGERRFREDWTFEMVLMLRNRFLAHELYDEYWGHTMSKKTWNGLIMQSEMMGFFRQTMFKRIVPNLKKIGLLTERVRPRYADLGLLGFESGRDATALTAVDLLEDR